VTPVPSRQGPLIVAISGASGVDYGITALRLLRTAGVPAHLVMTPAAALTLAHESELTVEDVQALADRHYDPTDIGAAIASGSFRSRGMLVAPCSVKTLAQIATGLGDTLLTRTADVVLKERRRLVLMVRETPLTLTHLRNMVTATENGAVVAPPVPALYARPREVSELITHTVSRALDLFDIDIVDLPRWDGLTKRSGTA
jgi:4-hydroxy-3-polyprenylbenzoate decarboxylase